MADVTERFPRLQYELMEFTLRLKGCPTGEEVDAACTEAWDRLQLDRPAADPIPFDEFRRLFEATLRRCPELRSRPAA